MDTTEITTNIVTRRDEEEVVEVERGEKELKEIEQKIYFITRVAY